MERIDIQAVLKRHKEFWKNNAGTRLRCGQRFDQFPLRGKLRREDIKGIFGPQDLETATLVADYQRCFQSRSVLNGDCLEHVIFAPVIPWMEAIIGCPIYSLGTTGSMQAKPINIEISEISRHFTLTHDSLETNLWFQALCKGTKALAETLGGKFPMGNVIMRGPGDMLGAALGYEQFAIMTMRPAYKHLLHGLLDLCADLWIKVAETQLSLFQPFYGGYCNYFGPWAPGRTIQLQEDMASLMSPTTYKEFLFPYHIKILKAFEFSTFHMHSAYLKIYAWRDLCAEIDTMCFEVSVDPSGPAMEDVLNTLLKINSTCPVIVGINDEHKKEFIERNLYRFNGAVELFNSIDFMRGFSHII